MNLWLLPWTLPVHYGTCKYSIKYGLSMGLTKIIESADPLLAGFGVVGLTSIGAMISVLILGILTRI